MQNYRMRRLIRLLIGGIVFMLPILMLVSVQVTPSTAASRAGMPAISSGYFSPSFGISATQTFTASQTFIAQTLTALPGTQTKVAATQTAIANNQTAVAATQTAQSQPTSTALFSDIYEPNNTIETAFTTSKGSALPSLTLWPLGDVDYFRFLAKNGHSYEVFTRDLTADLDTVLTALDPRGFVVDNNDDYLDDRRDSKVVIDAGEDGWYFVKVENKAPTSPDNKTYILEIKEVNPPTETPTMTVVPNVDACDVDEENRNDGFHSACLVLADEGVKSYDFVPKDAGSGDQDFYRVWVREGYFYTCETSDLSSLTDTKMHVLNQDGAEIFSNDDRAFGDVSSLYEQRVWFTGWLYFQIVPKFLPEYDLSDRYTYKFGCSSLFPTSTPTPEATITFTPFPTLTPSRSFVPNPGSGGGGGGSSSTRLPTVTFTPIATETPAVPPTPLVVFPTPEPPTPRPVVNISPLPTATSASAAPGQQLTVNVTVYYDSNNNFTAELNEGVMDVAVALYDNASNKLLSFGYSNDAGIITFNAIPVTGAVRMEVPFISYTQVIVSNAPQIQVRIAPATLPGGIP